MICGTAWRPLLLGITVAAVASLAAACDGDDCTPDQGYCQGNHLIACVTNNDNLYRFVDQGACETSTCVGSVENGLPVAACSTSGVPDPHCDEVMGGHDSTLCGSDNTLLQCSFGFSRIYDTCAVTCVDTADTAFCALAAAPDPRCESAGGWQCDADDLLMCVEGYLVQSDACAAPDPACIASSVGGTYNGNAYCATSASADPMCTASPGAIWCDGATAYACDGTYSIAETCSDAASCATWLGVQATIAASGGPDVLASCR